MKPSTLLLGLAREDPGDRCSKAYPDRPLRGSEIIGPSRPVVARRAVFAVLAVASTLSTPGCSRGGDGPRPGLEGGEDPGIETRPEQSFPVQITDASGTRLIFREAPGRIVCLVPALTRVLEALGARDLLVARTDYDTSVALAHLPSVGGGLAPNLEALIVQDPDLVIRFAGESDSATSERLRALEVRQLSVRLDRIADVQRAVLDLASTIGFPARGDSLVAEMDAGLEAVRRMVEGAPRVRVAYLLGGNPPWAAGPGTYIDELLTVAGGENVFSDLGTRYGPVSPEEFRVREIDLLVTAGPTKLSPDLTDLPVRRVPEDIEIPGPDLAQAARYLAEILHPEAFR